ncbi:hypothetical protein M9Y10_002170 [Tritrichomonas musculus]|uniref:Helicase ATP-binding domain-containing protein n=1 Tax=Tritrichomonas musculus TaxID=1915356 RepID=A0ABR2L9F3_9EUKA
MKVYGIDVDFPYPQPYKAQMALMAKAMKGFVKQENAILESPTGTGKSLALLSSSLAYQMDMKNKHPEAIKYNFNDSGDSSADNTQRPITIPKIWYTSRTHTQLTQLIGELRKLRYNPKMAILASRKQTCIYPKATKDGQIEANCQMFRKEHSCPYGQRTSGSFVPKELNTSPPPKFDIEELNGVCREDTRCPYFVSKNMVRSAELIFAPYNYVIDPLIRDQMSIDLKGSILIIDEAHNIEQTCRDAASLTIKYDDIVTRQYLWDLNEGEKELYPNLVRPYANIKSLLDSICNYFNNKRAEIDSLSQTKKNYIEEDDTQTALENKFNLSIISWNSLNQDYKFIMKADQENDNPNIQDRVPSQALVTILRMIFGPLQFLFMNGGANFQHFKIVYQFEKDNEGIKDQLKIICLNPAVVFNPISQLVHNVILTSGTLSPLNIFASELGASFPNLLSASHVIDQKQVVTVTISKSPFGDIMSSTYSNLRNNAEKTYLGLAEILKIILPYIPDGVLFFLPSYSMKNAIISTWKKKKCYDEIDKIKKIFIEEQGSKSDKRTLNQYKDHIRKCQSKVYKSPERGGNGEGGGLYIAVCRGKLSEGMDFHDNQARAVIIFGIPYPNIYEPEIILKKDYNDSRKNNESIGYQSQGGAINDFMSGKEWYEIQAFRALFQAVGRCIRHKDDYGSVILIDDRFVNDVKRFPQWVLRSWDGQPTPNYDDLKLKLSRFYGEMSINFPAKFDDDMSGEMEEASESLPFNLTCSDCTRTIFSSVMLKFESTIMVDSNMKGYLEIIKEQKPQLVYVMKEKEKKDSQAGKGDIIWCKDDLIVYEPILCAACEKVLGAKVICASDKDISLIGSYLLHVEKFYANQKGKSQPFGKIVKKPKVMKLNMDNTGDSKQARLSFV